MSDTARLDYVLSKFTVKRARGNDQYDVLCPVHGDKNSSAGVKLASSGSILINCMAGCSTEDIVNAAGLDWKDLFPPDDGSFERESTVPVASYVYTDAEGVPLFRVCKYRDVYGKKSFRQQAADGKGGWLPNLGTATRVPYKLPEVTRAAAAERRVIIVEGEKDVETLCKHGLIATTTPGGSGGWRPVFAEYFKGAEVIVIPDNDAPGKKYAKAICTDLVNARILDLPGLAEKEDVTDWLGKHPISELITLLGPESVEMNPCNWEEFQQETDKIKYLCGDILAAQTVNIMVADAGVGKALEVHEPVLTPGGWVEIGELRVGDIVIGGSNGEHAIVTGVYPRGAMPMYKVTTRDGATTRCSGDHLWTVSKRTPGKRNSAWHTLDTKTMHADARVGGANSYAIPYSPVIGTFLRGQEPPPIDPYLMGVYLGDGSIGHTVVTISNQKDELLRLCAQAAVPGDTWSIIGNGEGIRFGRVGKGNRGQSGIYSAIKQLGLLGKVAHEKFIPRRYMLGSADERLALLRGLLDTDGCVTKKCIAYTSTSQELAEGVAFVARSLGYRATSVRPVPHGVRPSHWHQAYVTQITLPPGLPAPFLLSHHLDRVGRMNRVRDFVGRRISSIVEDGYAECVCIMVDDPGSLYISNGFMVTHNTTLIAQMCMSLAAGKPFLGMNVPEPTPVLLLAAEGARPVLRERAELCRRSTGLTNAQLQRWYVQSKDLEDFRLSHVTLERQIKMSGAKVVVLDTLGYFLLPGDENSSKDWKQYVMEPIRYLKRKYDCAFILIHHEGKPSEFKTGHHRGRGTSAMFGDCDTWMSLEKRNLSDDDLILLKEFQGEEAYNRVLSERRLVWSKSKVGRFPAPIILEFDFENAIFRRKDVAEKVDLTQARRGVRGRSTYAGAGGGVPDPGDPFGV